MEPEICVRLRYPRQGRVFRVDKLFDIFCALIKVKDESIFFSRGNFSWEGGGTLPINTYKS